MLGRRPGNSLCEVLVALTLVASASAWALQAAVISQRGLGRSQRQRASLHRAERVLSELNALPCDSISIARTLTEPRWQLAIERDQDGPAYNDLVILRTSVGDTVRVSRSGWCAP
jgi:hypothetical protein